MCGIVAVFSWGEPVVAPDVESALDAIAHRGPDGRSTWRSDDGRVMLGHVRLAVRDLETGRQPITNEDGRVVVTVNGEIYGAVPQRRELERRGHVFRTKSDSEIVAHAWQEWGEEMFARLRGEFAFVLWDARSRVLVAARDRFGVKPLAWSRENDRVILASRARALFALGTVARWNASALFQSASLQYAPPDATLFANVQELAAGHALIAREKDVRIVRYWDLDYPLAKTQFDDERDAIERVRASFDDAVKERLAADVPIAFQLSGGVDSTAVLASARSMTGDPLHAFTVAFTGGEAYDESHVARATASELGAELDVIEVCDRDVADSFADAVVHAEGACINAHAAAKLLLHRRVRDRGFKVVLTGEGADEVLFGYAHMRSDLEGTTARVEGSNAASAGLMLPSDDGLSMLAIEHALGFVPTWIRAKASFGKRMHDLMKDSFLGSFRDRNPASTLLARFDIASQLEWRSRVEQSAYLWTKLALEGYILRSLGDGLEMASSVEGRLPFLDHVFFDLVRALPVDMKIRRGVEKWIFREAMRGRVPARVLNREKHPFLAPPMGDRTLAIARDVFHSASFESQPMIDVPKMRALVERVKAMPLSERKLYDPVLFFGLSIAVLQSRFGMVS